MGDCWPGSKSLGHMVWVPLFPIINVDSPDIRRQKPV